MVFDSDIMVWHKNLKNLSVDYSDLDIDFLPSQIGVKSKRTGDVEWFVFSEQVRCGTIDNEIVAFEFLPKNDIGVNKLVIFND